ncbi:hypothetical protein KGD82_09790 [Nocardiopsis eucommiae]|uniref:Uncharacterized protein n=1 Tax=Nocardiopsis eucommiae TaxID=2831970 RepID=A0A975QLL1_9ACTN|nr:hypothetical protein KGD82_09790 [Nocardiopsis eucommiae]
MRSAPPHQGRRGLSDERPEIASPALGDGRARRGAPVHGSGVPRVRQRALRRVRNGAWRQDERYVEILTVFDEAAYDTGVFSRALRVLRPVIEDVAARGRGAVTFAVNVTDVASAERLQGHRVEEVVAAPRATT